MRFLKSSGTQTAVARWLPLYGALTSFGVYFCMYAFRKPFTAAAYNHFLLLGVSYKIWLVAAQLIGYMASKFYGIRFIGALQPTHRARTILLLIGISWLALLFFAIAPAPYGIFFMLINGFPLGLVWGLVFSFLEGRRSTEARGAVLATSFIFSSGVVKTIGKWLMENKAVSENWMPFVTGAFFVLPLLLCTFLLNRLPPPTATDVALRTARLPMCRKQRRAFIAAYLPGLAVIVITYMLLTLLRDVRDNFSAEIWQELGYGAQPDVFAKTEIPVSIAVLLFMALLIIIKNNFRAFMINHILIVLGYALCLGSTLLFKQGLLAPIPWMTLAGTGLYMAYVPFNALYFERLIASFKIRGNVGFVMYIADAFGYLGSVAVLGVRSFTGFRAASWTQFFTTLVLVVAVAGMAGTAAAAVYFMKKNHTKAVNPHPAYAL